MIVIKNNNTTLMNVKERMYFDKNYVEYDFRKDAAKFRILGKQLFQT